MNIARGNRGKPISKVAATCKLLSRLCFAAFVLVIVWTIAGIVLMCVSLSEMSLNDATIPWAIAVPIVYALYNANSSLLPLTLGKMLGDLSTERSPFTLKNAYRLRVLALIMLLYDFLAFALDTVDTQFLFNIGELAWQVGSFIRDFSSSAGTPTLDVFPLVIAAVFFALSYVFKYGVLLQQESDETL